LPHHNGIVNVLLKPQPLTSREAPTNNANTQTPTREPPASQLALALLEQHRTRTTKLQPVLVEQQGVETGKALRV